LPSTSFAPIATTSAFDNGAKGQWAAAKICGLWKYQRSKDPLWIKTAECQTLVLQSRVGAWIACFVARPWLPITPATACADWMITKDFHSAKDFRQIRGKSFVI
jgi:hypothetical protein